MRSVTWSRSWLILPAAAILWGIYARFKGLGTWALGVDEFYISRSIDFILNSGIPQFPCGGVYQRGLLYQYVVAFLRFTGLSPEFAGRLVTASASLLVLPAVYLIGRRLQGRTIAILAVVILSLSVWEIEMARFARMYAPFQAVFAWFVVFFLRYAVDRERRALVPMIVLSVIGSLVWEGGALMVLIAMLAPLLQQRDGRLVGRDWLYLGGMGLLFAILFVWSTTEWRLFSTIPSLPEDYVRPPRAGTHSSLLLATLSSHIGWLVAALLPFGLAAISTRWIWSLRQRWLTAAGLLLVLLASLAHQLLLAAGLLVILILTRLVDWQQLKTRSARPYMLALAAAAVFWIIFGWLTLPGAGKPLALLHQIGGFPNVIDELARPWARTLPLLTLALGVAVVAIIVHVARRPSKEATTSSALVLLVVSMFLVIGASSPPRHETRYAFFLYPLLITLGIYAIALLAESITRNARMANILTVAGALAGFAVTGDFQPRHVAHIDSYESNFRVGIRPALREHYYPRDDVQRVATWLREHVQPGDVVVSGIPNIQPYYPGIDYFYLDDTDDRYRNYACNRGTTERWSSLPLLYKSQALADEVNKSRRTFIVTYPSRYARLQDTATALHWRTQLVRPSPDLELGARVMIVNP